VGKTVTVNECTGPVTTFIVEPFMPHKEEMYMSIQVMRCVSTQAPRAPRHMQSGQNSRSYGALVSSSLKASNGAPGPSTLSAWGNPMQWIQRRPAPKVLSLSGVSCTQQGLPACPVGHPLSCSAKQQCSGCEAEVLRTSTGHPGSAQQGLAAHPHAVTHLL